MSRLFTTSIDLFDTVYMVCNLLTELDLVFIISQSEKSVILIITHKCKRIFDNFKMT